MPARNKNRLAPLMIKPPKLRKYAAQSREKRRLCRQKPAAAAQYPNTQPTRDHANTPRQQKKAPYKALSAARRVKKNAQSNSKTPKMPRYPQKFTRRPAAMWQYNSLLCPQKSDNLSRSYVIYKEDAVNEGKKPLCKTPPRSNKINSFSPP